MSDADDGLVGRARSTSSRPTASVRVVVVTGEGIGLLLGRRHQLDRQRARRRRRPPAHPDDRLLPRLALHPPARGAHRSRRSTAHAIGAGLCLALACDLRYAAAGAKLGAPFVKLGMNPGHGRDLPAARRGRRGRRPRPAAHRPHRRGRGGAASSGLVSRVLRPARTSPREVAARSPRASPPRRPIASRYTTLALRARVTRTWSRACSGRRSPSRSRWPPPTSRRASRPRGRSARRSSAASEPRRVSGSLRPAWAAVEDVLQARDQAPDQVGLLQVAVGAGLERARRRPSRTGSPRASRPRPRGRPRGSGGAPPCRPSPASRCRAAPGRAGCARASSTACAALGRRWRRRATRRGAGGCTMLISSRRSAESSTTITLRLSVMRVSGPSGPAPRAYGHARARARLDRRPARRSSARAWLEVRAMSSRA